MPCPAPFGPRCAPLGNRRRVMKKTIVSTQHGWTAARFPALVETVTFALTCCTSHRLLTRPPCPPRPPRQPCQPVRQPEALHPLQPRRRYSAGYVSPSLHCRQCHRERVKRRILAPDQLRPWVIHHAQTHINQRLAVKVPAPAVRRTDILPLAAMVQVRVLPS